MDHKEKLFLELEKNICENPPILENINQLLFQFVNGLCRFCPSKIELNDKIKSDFPKKIDGEDSVNVINKLIFWIEKFQCPVDDKITKNMIKTLKENNYDNKSIIIFLRNYYDHTEKVYKETWEARKRLVNNENIIPPKHRPKNKNNIPNKMKTGK